LISLAAMMAQASVDGPHSPAGPLREINTPTFMGGLQ
jgi:hypothetical protein